jgi:hypothetical protein
MTFNIFTRCYSDTYIARSEGLQASCTMSAEAAARAVAIKVFSRSLRRTVDEKDITIRLYAPSWYIAETPDQQGGPPSEDSAKKDPS